MMTNSKIGGQAVMEGVMMRNEEKVAVALRLPDGSIHLDTKTVKNKAKWARKLPILRGIVSFVESLVIGMGTLMDSAEYFDEEPVDLSTLSAEEKKKLERRQSLEMTITLIFSVVLAVVIFMAIPYGISWVLGKLIPFNSIVVLIEGFLRIGLFVAYVMLISMMEDIKRVFMYHGAEHKCINCIESGLELNVENVRKSSKEHKRCGTSFLLYVMVISVVAFMFIRMDSALLQLACRLVLIPIIAGVSYEFIRLAGTTDNCVVSALSKPGLMLQGLTTREPDDSMIEVGIASVEAVFDWRGFLGMPSEEVSEEAIAQTPEHDLEEAPEMAPTTEVKASDEV